MSVLGLVGVIVCHYRLPYSPCLAEQAAGQSTINQFNTKESFPCGGSQRSVLQLACRKVEQSQAAYLWRCVALIGPMVELSASTSVVPRARRNFCLARCSRLNTAFWVRPMWLAISSVE
jgi:hypothetical protein